MFVSNTYSIKTFFILLLISFSISTLGQRTNFRFYQYNKDNKLNEELVKSIHQDSLGVYYFATDKGLISLVKDHFIPVEVQEGKNQFYKSLFKRKNGDLLALSDDGIYKITQTSIGNKADLLFLCNTDSILPKYPKEFFEDQNDELWLTDFNHIYRLKGSDFEQYQMDKKNQTTSYARSFQFLECDNGKLMVVSQSGWFYQFDRKNNQFKESGFNLDLVVNSSFKIGSNEFLLGTSLGIYRLILDFNGQVVHHELINESIMASCFQELSENKLLVGTWFQGILEIDLSEDFKVYPIGGFPCFTVNNIFLDDFGKFWIATNSGTVVMEKKFFSYQFRSTNSEYISSINLNEDGNVNFSGRKHIYKISNDEQIQNINLEFEGSINVFKKRNNISLLGTEQGYLYVYKNDELHLKLAIANKPITSIEIVSDREAWLVSDKELFHINLNSGLIKSYLQSFRGQRIVQDILLDKETNLFIGAEYKNSYLFKFDVVSKKVENISTSIDFDINEDFWVIDLEFDEDTLYMGTSSGLLKYWGEGIERVDLRDMTNSEVNSVAIDRHHSFWMTTSKGVIRKREKDLSLFTPEQGLPSKTFTNRNLKFDSNDHLWVGTSNGIAYASICDSIPKTPKPEVSRTDGGSQFDLKNGKVKINANSMLLLDVTATIYPQKQNQFQYCTVKGNEKIIDWKELSDKNQIVIPGLKTGKYKICIRGKHEGNYRWSEHRIVELNVAQVWYLRWYVLLVDFLLILVLIFLTNKYSQKRAQQNLIELEKQVSERTVQLQDLNKHLVSANVAKDKFLSIIAHDLRNPFNAIRGFSKILLKDSDILSEEDRTELIETIYRSSDDTFKLLESLLEWANVQKGNFKLNSENFDLKTILEKNLGLHKSLGSLKGLTLIGDFNRAIVKADKAMIDTVIRNLLSNAIKYSKPNQIIKLQSIEANGFIVVQVTDQGVGMTEKQLKNLFKIDTVTTSEGTANETGTGFGLMLSKEFVELNGGKIWVESEKNKGTSFFFSIPRK